MTGSCLRVGELRNGTQHLVYCSCHFWQYISHDHAQLYQTSGPTFMLLRVVWCICPPKSTTSCWDGYREITIVRPTREKWTYLPPVLWFPKKGSLCKRLLPASRYWHKYKGAANGNTGMMGWWTEMQLAISTDHTINARGYWVWKGTHKKEHTALQIDHTKHKWVFDIICLMLFLVSRPNCPWA